MNEISDVYNANATISFLPSCKLNGPLINYVVRYEALNGKGVSLGGELHGMESAYVLILKPEYTYSYNITTQTMNYSNIALGKSFTSPAGGKCVYISFFN